MARQRRRYTSPLPSTRTPGMRLALSIGMLIVLGMLIRTTGNAANWRWIEGGRLNAKEEPRAGTTVRSSDYQATPGPTDLDPAEWDEATKLFAQVTDRGLKNNARDVEAYRKLMKWTVSQTPEQLAARKEKLAMKPDVMDRPEHYRGKLFQLTLNVMQAHKIEDEEGVLPESKQRYALAGFAPNFGTFLFMAETPGIPKGFPIGGPYDPEKVVLDGYFFKLTRYMSGLDDGKPRIAPVFVGSMRWERENVTAETPPSPAYWAAVGGGFLAIVLAVGWFVRRTAKAELPTYRPTQSTESMQEWLNDPVSDDPSEENRRD